jgi:hypothetical protein
MVRTFDQLIGMARQASDYRDESRTVARSWIEPAGVEHNGRIAISAGSHRSKSAEPARGGAG